MNIASNISLLQYNTFGMDVTARWFCEITGIDDLKSLFAERKWKDSSHLILGGGSNILFTKNVDALVIRNCIQGIEVILEDDSHWYVRAGAGLNWHAFVLDCINQNRSGVENLSLIPGSVGAGPMQNIGAYGVELKDVFDSLEAYHIQDGYLRIFTAEDCKFGYRESVFKRELRNQFIIVSVTFRLPKQPIFRTDYGAIAQELENIGTTSLSIKAISDAVIRIRSSKLPDPAVLGNAGSFFKNPVIDTDHYTLLKKDHPDLVAYPSGKDYKLAAGWLIEKAGWKGFRDKNCGVHQLQALVLVNYSSANGQEIYDLSERILQSVKEKFGVTLEREVNIY